MPRTGSYPVDINRFRSHTEKKFTCHICQVVENNPELCPVGQHLAIASICHQLFGKLCNTVKNCDWSMQIFIQIFVQIFFNLCIKVIGCVCVCVSYCLSVQKDIPNRQTDMVLFCNYCHRSWEGFLTIFGEGTTTLPREIARRKYQKIFKLHLVYPLVHGHVQN